MKIKFLIPLILSIGQIFAKDDFFTNDDRAEIFQKTDFVVPKITVNFSEEDYKNFFLKYQCEYDMHPRNAIRNDDCYKAPWVDLDYALSKAFRNNIINKNSITDSNDLNIIKKGNITLTNFENLVKKYTDLQLENVLTTTNGLIKIPDQIADEASMTFDINGDVHNVDRIKISVGGKYTKSFEKLGFNIKIKKGKLLGRKQLRLRSEAVDPSFLREKLAYDICNELGLPSLSANFVEVYFNKKFMGFYVMRDAFKSQWIEDLFGESGTKTLYTCDRNYGNNKFFNCINDDEDITDDATFKAFQDKLEQTKTKSELEQFFNVPLFLKWQALKYLFGSWDHITNAHNSYVYRDVRNKWHVFLYDFDSDLGAYKNPKTNRTFEKEIFDNNNPLFKDILKLHENENLVSEYIEQFMKKVFNPKKLIPRIDKLKKFIGPYVKNDRKRDEDGNLQGRIKRVNIKVEDYFTYDDFDKNSEFTNVQLRKYQSDKVFTDDYIYGLKSWIIERFEFACRKYKFDCSYASEYLSTPDYNHETVLLEETNDETDSFRNSLFRLNPLFDNFSFYTQEEIPSSNSFELNEGNQSFNRDDSKANSFLNEKVKRGRKKDSAIGNKRPAHGKLARDNIKRKIQVHYLNFLRNFVNQILYDILDQYKDMKYNQFYPLNHSFTKDITKKSFDKLKKTTIGKYLKIILVLNLKCKKI